MYLGENGMMEAIGISYIVVEIDVWGHFQKKLIKDMLHMPKLYVNLLSMSKMASQDLKVQFNKNYVFYVFNASNGEMIVITPKQDNLYQLEYKIVNGSSI